MNHRYILLPVILVLSYTAIAQSQSQQARCFQFTWLGPRYNNESVFLNSTCQDATRLAEGVPCFEPLVSSYDGTWPDVEYIWTHHGQHASCILSSSDVCAQYTYYFDGNALNSTYMCTRAVDNLDQAITNGCYEEKSGSFSTRVCFCRSIPGGVPCNKAVSLAASTSVIVLLAVLIKGRLDLTDRYLLS